MKFKKPASLSPLPLITFVTHKKRYRIDHTYQREAGTWSRQDQQYLIDTILRGYPMPPIFIHEKNENEFIVDGQQRLNAIWRFHNGKCELSEKFSTDIINDDKNIVKNKEAGAYLYHELHKDWQDRFDTYPVPIISLRDYNDEEIRDLFRRLQHGKPLIPGEILNAYPGRIVLTMREISKHKFFGDILPISSKRYKHYFIASQFMYIESEGIKDISPNYIYNFFEHNKDIKPSSKIYKNINKTLNYIHACLKDKTPEIRKPGWLITIYLVTSNLLENYTMKNQKANLKRFIVDFYNEIMGQTDIRNRKLMQFKFAISRSTTKSSNIKLRYEIIRERFIKEYKPLPLDEKRIFSADQKDRIFRRDNGRCQIGGERLTFGSSNTHYHHMDRYIEGGKTDIANGLLVCKKCHLKKIHSK